MCSRTCVFRIILISVCIFLWLPCFNSEKTRPEPLHFISLENARKEDVVYLTNDDSIINIDASSSASRVVYFSKLRTYMTYTFNISCRVNKQLEPLKMASFCCRSGREAQEQPCQQFNPKSNPSGTISCFESEFVYHFDELNGIDFTLKFAKKRLDRRMLSGIYSCSVTDAYGSNVVSTEVEVRDASYYFRQLPLDASDSVTVINPIGRSDFPFAFKCAADHVVSAWPDWMDASGAGSGVYHWAYCKISGAINVHTCNQRRVSFPEASIIPFVNGTMYLLDPAFIAEGDIVILCRVDEHGDPIKTFAGGASKTNYISSGLQLNVLAPYSTHLESLVSTDQRYVFYSGSNLEGVLLRALYREPLNGSDFMWFKDGEKLPSKGATKFSFQLSSRPETDIEGQYELVVTSKSNPRDKLIFKYKVDIVYPPKFTDPACLAKMFYVMKGSDFHVTCKFTPKYFRNLAVGVDQFVGTSTTELRSRLYKQSSLNKLLSELNIEFSVHPYLPKYQEAIVDIKSMQVGQDFELILRLDGEYGGSHMHSFLKVIPTPVLSEKPESASCYENCDVSPYNVSCAIDRDLLTRWRDQYDVNVSVTWVIQNQWLSEHFESTDVGHFFSVPNADGSILSVWPHGRPVETTPASSESNNEEEKESTPHDPLRPSTLQQFISRELGPSDPFFTADLLLRCRIRLYVNDPKIGLSAPPEIQLHRVARNFLSRSAVSGQSAPRLLYDSSWETDSSLVNQLTARRVFTLPPAKAGLAWIAAVVIGIIVVLSVIMLSVWLYTRDRGETYKVYEKEKAYGNDPIQEIKEAELFKTYQRQEEQPIASSHYSLNDESMHVGSEDEGELSQYGADYDEHGSFIHGYATDPALPRNANNTARHNPQPNTFVAPPTFFPASTNHVEV